MSRLLAALILLCTTLLTACSEEDIGPLEGVWRSQCFAAFADLGFTNNTGTSGSRLQYSFIGSAVTVQGVEFSDTECTMSETIINAKDSSLFSSNTSMPSSFTLGSVLTTNDGDTATEIDITFDNGSIKKEIFLIQDNTLYFGVQSQACINAAISGSDTQECYDTRPDSIYFSVGYAKNGQEPVVIIPAPVFDPNGPPVFNAP